MLENFEKRKYEEKSEIKRNESQRVILPDYRFSASCIGGERLEKKDIM